MATSLLLNKLQSPYLKKKRRNSNKSGIWYKPCCMNINHPMDVLNHEINEGRITIH
ncbi:hypothetical protein PFLA_b0111 [Pseudoalteromonas flavipulchra NCIMB 2033 = ATCC BAA-314]|nr:hypothetical protein [Pseudoalteromonas flavipulchra NCIMB 2033 = ATCC BAA-314]